jgi:hypothetical protein
VYGSSSNFESAPVPVLPYRGNEELMTSRQCQQAWNSQERKYLKDIQLKQYEILYLSTIIYNLESKVKTSEKNNDSFGFFEFFFDQYKGILVGSFFSILFYFADQRYAYYYSKKHGIEAKTVAKSLFPTLICLVQVLLRHRNKNSKLALILSLLKKQNPNAQVDQTPQTIERPKPFVVPSTNCNDSTSEIMVCPKFDHVRYNMNTNNNNNVQQPSQCFSTNALVHEPSARLTIDVDNVSQENTHVHLRGIGKKV